MLTFSAAGLDEPRGVIEGAYAAADGERHEDFFGDAPHHVEHDVAALVAGGDVEEHQLVGPVLLIATGHFHRIAGIARLEEVDFALTTRPRFTSRQGMIRLVSASGSASSLPRRPHSGDRRMPFMVKQPSHAVNGPNAAMSLLSCQKEIDGPATAAVRLGASRLISTIAFRRLF